MEEIILDLEHEGDAPIDWQSETILERDGKGNVFEVIVPDDEDGDADVAND